MKFIVAKPFTTHLQRFAVGAPVADTDNLAPFDLEGLRARRWIAEESTKTPEKAMDEAAETETPLPPDPPSRARRAS